MKIFQNIEDKLQKKYQPNDPHYNKDKNWIEFNTTFYSFQKEEIQTYIKIVKRLLSDNYDILINELDIISHNYVAVTVCLKNLTPMPLDDEKTQEKMRANFLLTMPSVAQVKEEAEQLMRTKPEIKSLNEALDAVALKDYQYDSWEKMKQLIYEELEDWRLYKEDGYIPYHTFLSNDLDIEVKFPFQNRPSLAMNVIDYEKVFVEKNGDLTFYKNGVELKDILVYGVTYKILPKGAVKGSPIDISTKQGKDEATKVLTTMDKKYMVTDDDFLELTKEEFEEELTKRDNRDRHFDSIAYRIVKMNNDVLSCKMKMEKDKDGKKIAEILAFRKDNKIPIELEIIFPTNISIAEGETYLKTHFIDLYRPSRKISMVIRRAF